ncbi:RHS repeat domain-containing protein, partial [Flavobacterium humi]
ALGLQKVDYNYNIRGWLKGINDVANLTQGANPVDLFAFKVNYQDNDTQSYGVYSVPPLYNGNISETFWRTSSDNVQRKYGYNYDNLNRLTGATYQKPGAATPTTNSYNETLAYDKNGNITALTRTGEYDDADYSLEVDNLAYTYHADNKNQLMKVFDSTNNTNGFKDDSTGTSDPADDYTYDANGNMTADTNKGITQIVYNHMNLPIKIVFNNNNSTKIEYLYNAAGIKLQKNVTQGSTITATQYFNGFQYTDGVLQFFMHDEGYVNNTVVNGNNVYNYVFNYTDHLGNVRLSYGVDPATSVLKVLEENNYYPFGLKHKNYNMSQKTYIKDGGKVVLEPCSGCAKTYQYKFNGQEWQDELGLNLYDYDNRAYDPANGRFLQMDPKGELGRRWSPYNYCFDNPVYFQDPDGMWPWPTWMGNVQQFAKGFVSSVKNIAEGAQLHNQVIGQVKLAYSMGKSVVNGDLKGAGKQFVDGTGIPAVINTGGKALKGDFKAMGEIAGVATVVAITHKAAKSSTSAVVTAETAEVASTPKAPVTTETTNSSNTNMTSPNFVVTTGGDAIPIPEGATGPTQPMRGTGMVYQGGSGGFGMDPRTTGVRIMDANANQGSRVNYMNNATPTPQTVNPATGRPISNSDPAGHIPINNN